MNSHVNTPTSVADLKDTVDFAIIAIREDEYRAVLKYFPQTILVQDGKRIYVISDFETLDGSTYRAAIMRSHEQGHSAAQSATSDVISDLHPQWIVLVGIAGAVPEYEFSLGDVVVATRLHDFSVTAAQKNGSMETMGLGGPSHKAVQDLASVLPALESKLGNWNSVARLGSKRPGVTLEDSKFHGDESWKGKLKDALMHRFDPATGSDTGPRATATAVVSANMLMKNPDILQKWITHARDLKAVEMELGGVYEAARDKAGDTPILAIRGISDVVGFSRDAGWTAYACLTAASFCRALLGTRPIEPRSASLEKKAENTPSVQEHSTPASRPGTINIGNNASFSHTVFGVQHVTNNYPADPKPRNK